MEIESKYKLNIDTLSTNNHILKQIILETIENIENYLKHFYVLKRIY